MGIQHTEVVPESFSASFGDRFLGNPQTVATLVGEFLAKAEALMMAGGHDFTEKANALVREYADIFSGRNGGYTFPVGYNDVSLPGKLMADLGEFWRRQRSKWGDDPVCVLFEWLFVMLAESIKKADGDDDLLEVMMKPSAQYANQVLLGTDRRRA